MSENGRDGGGNKLMYGNGRAEVVNWNLELSRGEDWAGDWTRDGDVNANANRNILARTRQHKSYVKEK